MGNALLTLLKFCPPHSEMAQSRDVAAQPVRWSQRKDTSGEGIAFFSFSLGALVEEGGKGGGKGGKKGRTEVGSHPH